jgi:hypothetical protein
VARLGFCGLAVALGLPNHATEAQTRHGKALSPVGRIRSIDVSHHTAQPAGFA